MFQVKLQDVEGYSWKTMGEEERVSVFQEGGGRAPRLYARPTLAIVCLAASAAYVGMLHP